MSPKKSSEQSDKNTRRSILLSLFDSLKQTPGLTPEDEIKIRTSIQDAYDRESPPVIVLIGETGVGKSTTINALFNAGQEESHVRAMTKIADAFNIIPRDHKGTKGLIRIYDMPGVGDDISTYEKYRQIYVSTLSKADAILWIHPCEDRMVMLMQLVFKDLFGANGELTSHQDRLVIGLNKLDQLGPANWNPIANLPSDAQLQNAEVRVAIMKSSIKNVLPNWNGEVVAYSALRRFGLPQLFRALMYAVPTERRWVLEDRMALADFLELVDDGLIKAVRDELKKPAVDSASTGRKRLMDNL